MILNRAKKVKDIEAKILESNKTKCKIKGIDDNKVSKKRIFNRRTLPKLIQMMDQTANAAMNKG